jgi:hypothetical protein
MSLNRYSVRKGEITSKMFVCEHSNQGPLPIADVTEDFVEMYNGKELRLIANKKVYRVKVEEVEE